MINVLMLLSIVAASLFFAGLHLGVKFVPTAEVLSAISGTDTDATALIVRTLRLPRGLLAFLVGGTLGLAGLLMQTATRNPIAEPGLLGINAGASFAVVLLITVFPGASGIAMMVTGATGALLATCLVLGLTLSATGKASPVYLLLAGVTIAALLNAGIQVLVILNEAAMEELLFWLSGAFADRPLRGVWIASPVFLIAFAVTLYLGPMLDVLTTDDATAETLGVPVAQVRLGIAAVVAALAGCAVALAGPIAFVGLVSPHLARLSGAVNHRQLIPLAVLWGAVLALGADIAARFILYPSEAPISAVMALVGVPLLILLLRRRKISAA